MDWKSFRKPLGQSNALDQIAAQWAAAMTTNSYYAHLGSDGKFFSDLMKENHVGYTYACENLNIAEKFDADYYVKSWLSSPNGHKECMLGDSHKVAGYATASIKMLSGIPVNE